MTMGSIANTTSALGICAGAAIMPLFLCHLLATAITYAVPQVAGSVVSWVVGAIVVASIATILIHLVRPKSVDELLVIDGILLMAGAATTCMIVVTAAVGEAIGLICNTEPMFWHSEITLMAAMLAGLGFMLVVAGIGHDSWGSSSTV